MSDFDGQNLYKAVENGRLDQVEVLIKRGANVNWKNSNGWTPLHQAVSFSRENIIQCLLENGAHIDIQNKSGQTPLLLAISQRYEKGVQCLLEKGARVDLKDQDRQTPLHLAVSHGHDILVQSLLEKGAHIDIQNKSGQTPLHLAIYQGYEKVVQCLLEKGARVDLKDEDGQTPLHLAASRGHEKLIQSLLEKGARVDLKDNKGATPLMSCYSEQRALLRPIKQHMLHVVENGTTLQVSQVLRSGISCEVTNEKWQTLLHIAANRGQVDIVQCLLSHGVNPIATDQDGQTPIHLAAIQGHTLVVDILSSKVPVDLYDICGETALHKAVQSPNGEKVIPLLLDRGYSLEAQTNNGDTPLMLALKQNKTRAALILQNYAIFQPAANGSLKSIVQLLNDGTSIDIKNEKNQTLLHVAASRGYLDMVKFLIARGINVDSTDEYGQTALHYATEIEHKEIIQFLIDAGSSLDIKDKNGKTPLMLAELRHNSILDIIKSPTQKFIDAVYQGDKGQVLQCLHQGAKINTVFNAQQTALHVAALYNDASMASLLLYHGASINCADQRGQTPLHIAAENGNTNIVKQLLSKSPDLNLRDKDGRTPLYTACVNGHDFPTSSLSVPMNYGTTKLPMAYSSMYDSLIPCLITPQNANIGTNDTNDSPLYIAAQKGYAKIVMELLENEFVQVDFTSKNGDTALHAAVNGGHKAIVLILLAKGALIDKPNKDNESALMIATRFGLKTIVQILIENGANANLQSKTGDTPLHIAATNNALSVMKILLTSKVDSSIVNKKGNTALDIALSKRYNDIVCLLQRDPKEQELVAAVEAGDGIHQLISDGIDPNYIQSKIMDDDDVSMRELAKAIKQPSASLDAKQEETSHSPVGPIPSQAIKLLDGVATNNIEFVKSLLAVGAEANISNEMGTSLVHIAAGNGFVEMLDTLIENRARIDVIDENGCSPLHVACANGQVNAVQWLLDAGADGNHPDKRGNTALHIAAASGHDVIVAVLLKLREINHSAVNEEGMTPLQLAAQSGMTPVVDLLLDREVDINHQCKDGQTALHLAASNGFALVVEKLLAKKAQVNILSSTGETPLQCAERSGNEQTIHLLFNAGLKLNEHQDNISRIKQLVAQGADVIDENGNSLLHLAVQRHMIDMVKVLLSHSTTNILQPNNDNKTPLLLAIQLGYRDIAQCLYDAAVNDIIVAHEGGIVFNEKPLGFGAYGSVYKGTVNGQVVAVKKSNRDSVAELLTEIDTMKKCRSPYIVRAIAIDENVSDPSLALEFMDCGNLREYLDAKRSGIETKINVNALQVAWVLANALADLHRNNLMHRDLKSLNVLLSTEHYIKLGDFGTSREVTSMVSTKTGTPLWTAPEVLESGSHYSFPADIYSFGVILTELDTLQLPYSNIMLHTFTILEQVRQGKLRPSVSANCQQWLRELAEQCLAFDPSQRPTAEQIVVMLENELRGQQNAEPEIPKEINKLDEKDTSAFPMASSTGSYQTSASKLLSTKISCKTCRMNNCVMSESCENCSALMPTKAERVNILLKRLNVATKKNVPIEMTKECDICGIANPIDAVTCCDEDCATELTLLSDEEKLIKLKEAFERVKWLL